MWQSCQPYALAVFVPPPPHHEEIRQVLISDGGHSAALRIKLPKNHNVEPTDFKVAAQGLNQMCHRIPRQRVWNWRKCYRKGWTNKTNMVSFFQHRFYISDRFALRFYLMANTTTPYKLYFYHLLVFLFVVPVGLLYRKNNKKNTRLLNCRVGEDFENTKQAIMNPVPLHILNTTVCDVLHKDIYRYYFQL